MTEALQSYLSRLLTEIAALEELLAKSKARAAEVAEIIAQADANRMLVEALQTDLEWTGADPPPP